MSMLTNTPEEVTLEQVMAVPGIGAQVMGALPIPDRVRLRRTCRTFLTLADESLTGLTEVFGEDVAGEGCRPGTTGLTWLLSKCSKLQALSVVAREHQQVPWRERDRLPLTWPKARFDYITAGVLSLKDIAVRYQGLVQLNLSGCRDVRDAGLVALAQHCPGLQTLDVSGCRGIRDMGVVAVAASCTGLLRLLVSGCTDISDESILVVAQHCPRLQVLCVDYTRVTAAGVAAIAESCGPNLRRVAVPYYEDDSGIARVAACCPLLEQLSVWTWWGVADSSIKGIAEGCPLLQRLDLPRSMVTDASVSTLSEHCAGLRHVNLANTLVGDEGVRAVAMRCAVLEHLDVGGCRDVTDAGVVAVATRCARLRHLDVTGCHAVGDESVGAVAANCAGLQVLIVRDTNVWDDSMRAIADHCRELRCLDLAGCRSEGGESLALVAQACTRLEQLDISHVDSITHDAMLAIARNSARLRVLRAGGHRFPADVLSALVKERGRQLWALDLSKSMVTDDIVALVAQSCPRLQELRVKACWDVTDKGLAHFARGCPQLQCLDVEGCNVTGNGVGLLDGDRCDVYCSTWPPSRR